MRGREIVCPTPSKLIDRNYSMQIPTKAPLSLGCCSPLLAPGVFGALELKLQLPFPSIRTNGWNGGPPPDTKSTSASVSSLRPCIFSVMTGSCVKLLHPTYLYHRLTGTQRACDIQRLM